MADDASVVVTGDVSGAQSALKQLGGTAQETAADVDAITKAFTLAEAEAKEVVTATKLVAAAIGDLDGLLAKGLGETKALAQARAEEASLLEHQAQILRAVGAEQAEIVALQDKAIQKRIEAALLADREGEAIGIARRQEIRLLERITAEQRQASNEVSKANDERIAGFKRAEGEVKRLAAQTERLNNETQEAARALTNAGAAKAGFGAVAASVGSVVTGLQSALALASQAVALADDIAADTIIAQNLTTTLAIPIGEASAALGGYVSQVDIAKQANKAFKLGVVENSKEFAELARGIAAIAAATGGDVTHLLEQAVEAVGKGSVERLDNVLVLLTQTEAEQEYADSLSKTVDQLSDLERAEAIQEVALQRIGAAAKETTLSADGLAQAWARGRISAEDFVNEALGFDDSIASVKEALRSLSEDELSRLDFAEFAGEGAEVTKEVNKFLDEWGVSLMDVKQAADDLGVSYDEVLQNARNEIGQREAKKQERILQGQAIALREQAVEAEHVGDLLRAQGFDQEIITEQIQEGLSLRIQAAEAENDIAKATELTRKLEVEQLKAATEASKPARKSGRRRDPNAELDRTTAALLRNLEAREQIRGAELEFTRDLDLRAAREFELIELQREGLEIRRQAAEQTVTRGAQERADLELEQLSIRTEARLLDLEVQRVIRDEEQIRAEARISGLDREIERMQALGVETGLLEAQRAQAAMDLAEQFGTAEELTQVAHEAEILRIEETRAAEVAVVEGELEEFNNQTELMAARGMQVEDLGLVRLELEARVAAAEGNTDKVRESLHKREVARIKIEIAARKRALSNTKSFLSQGSAFASTIVDAAIKDDARREKAALRLRGVESLAVGALEVVQAVASFASFNFVQGALHTAAAAVAFTQGALMIAGNVPGAGSASASAPSAPAPGAALGSDGGGAAREVPTAPTSAEELIRIRGGGEVASSTEDEAAGPSTVVTFQNSTIITGDSGALLDDVQDRQQVANWGGN